MITSRSVFGMAVILLVLGVIGSLAGVAADKHSLSILGGALFGSGLTFLAIDILSGWGSYDDPR